MTSNLLELAKHWEGQCNRYTNGRCTTRTCLVRGGYRSGAPDYETATCEEHETALALRSRADGAAS
jgi:hypothetical protein